MKTYEYYPYATKITNDNKTYKKFIKNLYYENIPLSDILSCDITNDLLADNPILSGINSLRKRIREDSQIYKIVFDLSYVHHINVKQKHQPQIGVVWYDI